ncbi:HAD-IIB family hydrolase [Rhodococcus rhodnii]|uniref:Uncharacterized protein n=2 Tax=Rhodococcus rhodnii TaxID=38312 RepID=R7WKH0_9NOCA|nr:HAD-IIB family hydrolase [Rhodococcus rhodnii]EOM74519.1 hypothetical protein Rrhod_4322 [Rhodococcus rhodnii LMG 5362]TXG89202.1 HAD-IIB family hydrolase [Rhodococcus rhodnii]
MNDIRLVATDLDETLLRSDHSVSARTAAALAAAEGAGIEIVWATARARHSVGALAAEAGFRGLAVCANGAVALDLADGTPVITNTIDIEIEAAAAAMAAVRELLPGVVFANVGPTTFVAEPSYAGLCEFVDHYRHPHEMDLAETLPSIAEPMVKIVARHPDVPASELYRLVLASAPTGVAVTHSGAPYIEMAAAGVSKAAALAELVHRRGLTAANVAAIGDAINDVPMLEWAGTALCPATAMPEVRALADRILPGNDDDGVAQYLEELAAR